MRPAGQERRSLGAPGPDSCGQRGSAVPIEVRYLGRRRGPAPPRRRDPPPAAAAVRVPAAAAVRVRRRRGTSGHAAWPMALAPARRPPWREPFLERRRRTAESPGQHHRRAVNPLSLLGYEVDTPSTAVLPFTTHQVRIVLRGPRPLRRRQLGVSTEDRRSPTALGHTPTASVAVLSPKGTGRRFCLKCWWRGGAKGPNLSARDVAHRRGVEPDVAAVVPWEC